MFDLSRALRHTLANCAEKLIAATIYTPVYESLRPNGVPLAFTPEFYEDENKVKQWNAFCNKNKPYVQQTEFKDIITRLASFLVPVIRSAQQQRILGSTWTPVHAWRPAPDQ